MTSFHHERALAKYNANPKICPRCGNPVPYEKRHQTYCSAYCANPIAFMTEEEREQYWKNYHHNYNENHKDERISYRKQYRAKNRDKLINASKHYYQANRTRLLQKNKEYRSTHKEQYDQYHKDYAIKNRDRIKTYKANYYQEHKDEYAEQGKIRRANNKEHIKEHKRAYFVKHGCGPGECAVCHKTFKKTACKQRICPACRAYRDVCLKKNNSTYKNTVNGSEHRQVAIELGILTPDLVAQGFVVHHRDRNRRNNTRGNLIVLKRGDHSRLHKLIEEEWIDHPTWSLEQLNDYVLLTYHIKHFF